MKQPLKWVLSAAAIVAAAVEPASANPIIVTPGPTAAQMVSTLVGSSPGITVVAGSETYVGAPIAAGLFSGGTGILPFDSGIALTSGAATFIPGPNNSPNRTQDNQGPGDAQLTALAGGPTFDAARLNFSFIPTNSTISFQYVFGSEEYNEYVGSPYNDVFAFFLNGVNIALIPSTSTPVTINTVNLGSNAQYYFDNASGGPNAKNIQYDGLVGVNAGFVMFATGSVNPNVVNTISLAIADTGDYFLDSGVMLQGGSFVNEPPPTIPEPGSLLLLGTGATALVRRFRNRR